MRLFQIIREDGSTHNVAAEDFKRVVEVYDHVKSINAVADKIIVLKNRDGSDPYSDLDWMKADSRFPPKDKEDVVEYIQRLGRMIVDLECSNRGFLSVFNSIPQTAITKATK